MKEKKNIIIVVLILLLGVSLVYIGYDKLMSDKGNNVFDNDNQESENKEDNGLEEFKNDFTDFNDYDELGLIVYFEDYIKHIPQRYVDNKLASYKTTELTDKEISMFVWRYISEISGTDYNLSVEHINMILKNYLDLDNYQVKEMEIETEPTPGESWHIFGLKKENDKYVISVVPTEFSFSKYRVKEIEYNHNNREIIVYFDIYSTSYFMFKEGYGKAILKGNSTGSFNIVEVII